MSRHMQLPQKRYLTKLKFENPVICEATAVANGLDANNLTEEQKQKLTLKECIHVSWPPFMPQCTNCYNNNKCERYWSSKKHGDFKVL